MSNEQEASCLWAKRSCKARLASPQAHFEAISR
jgi:hypothetical protein